MATKKKILISAFVVIYLILNSNIFSQNFWQQTNGPYGGIVSSFAFDSSLNRLYCFAGNGLYYTTDLGQQWNKFSVPFVNPAFFTVHPNGTYFLSQGDDHGIYRSTNCGLNWTHITNGIPSWVWFSCLAFSDAGLIFAGSNGGGIYRSADNGSNWNVVFEQPYEIRTLTVNHKGYIYAGTYLNGLFRSTNDGINWSLIAFPNTSIYGFTFDALDYLYAGMDSKIYRSTDDGETWELVATDLISQSICLLVGLNNYVYAGTEYKGVFRSTDRGQSWEQVNQGIYNRDIISFGQQGQIMFSGTDWGDGVYASSNNGDLWEVRNHGLKVSYIPSIAISNSGKIFAHMYRKGIYTSTDQGDNWVKPTLCITNDDFMFNRNSIAISPNGDIFTDLSGIVISTDNGNSWQKISVEPIGTSLGIYVAPNYFVFSASWSGIFRSTNYGINWVRLNFGNGANVNALGISDEGILFTGTNLGVFKSSDNGDNWTECGIGPRLIDNFAFDKSGNVYVGCTDFGVFKSSDCGNSWENIGLGGRDVFCILVNSEEDIFATTEYGLFMKDHNNNNWINMEEGLLGSGVATIAIDSNGYVFLGTWTGGVFRTSVSTISVKSVSNEVPALFNLGQNHPNPFNPTTRIRFEIPIAANVKIAIFDILGREVEVLVNKKLVAGSYVVSWNAENFSSGIYFYSLQTGEFTQTKKMILLK